MCDLFEQHHHSGFLVDTPAVRALVADTQRLMREVADAAARVEQDETIYRRLDRGQDEGRAALEVQHQQRLSAGEFYALLPPQDDIHYVETVSDTPSISIHLLDNDTA